MYDPRKGQQNLSALCLIYWSYFGTILCINTLRFWLIILISIFLWIVWLPFFMPLAFFGYDFITFCMK